MKLAFSCWWLVPMMLLVGSVCFAQEWVARYNGPGNGRDDAYAIAVDGTGNVYVTGWSIGSGTYEDYATIKYNSAGDTLWVRRYNGPGNGDDRASAIAVDTAGNVYVTGYSWLGAASDYATIKYNSAGDTVWVKRYNGPGNGIDYAYAIAVDGAGNVYVTGTSPGSGTSRDYATIKYNSAGDTLWVRRYNGPGNGRDEATAIAVDGTGDVYVTGRSVGSGTDYDYATIKYNSAGDTVWVRRYNGPGNGDDRASAIAVDGTGNVYVTGWSIGSGTYEDYATIKYNSAGDTVWVRRYNAPGNGTDYAYAIAVDTAGNVYVTGWSIGSGTYEDYATIKYNSAGDTVWVRRYNGPGNYDDEATAIAVDGTGNVYVTGESYGSDTSRDYATIKYNSAGDTVWLRRYNGPGNDEDRASAIAVDGTGNVYVTGWSVGSGTSDDYATIKYSGVGVEEWENPKLELSPNPAIGSAVINYWLPSDAKVSLSVYDISGRLVRTIYFGLQEKGYHKVEPSPLPTGIYFVRFEAGAFKATHKLTILKW